MVCGTASDVGKTQLVAGLCRVLARQGVRVAPFKAQNMALNSFVTPGGHEIGRAQAMQAMAAGAVPDVMMNPILLKPTGERTSQVVVMGRPWKTLDAVAYHAAKPGLRELVMEALCDLRSRYDVVLLEGAGSPAEINLLDHDLVNLGLASAARIPAIVVGDIDRGGVFAALYGTVALLPDELRQWVRGFVINKFRGDPALLAGGVEDLQHRCGVPTLGVVPFTPGLDLDAEDSLALSRWSGGTKCSPPQHESMLDVAVIRFPRISNFTDLDALAIEPSVRVRLVDDPTQLGAPDVVVLPGTKATVDDLTWFRSAGFDVALDRLRLDGQGGTRSDSPLVVGICGGYQMLGHRIDDPDAVESNATSTAGLALLDIHTEFAETKRTSRHRGTALWPRSLPMGGYEIRHGRSVNGTAGLPWFRLEAQGGDGDEAEQECIHEGTVDASNGVVGTAMHGLFECDELRGALLAAAAARRGRRWSPSGLSFDAARQDQIDRLGDLCTDHLDLLAIWRLVAEGARADSDDTAGQPPPRKAPRT